MTNDGGRSLHQTARALAKAALERAITREARASRSADEELARQLTRRADSEEGFLEAAE